MFSVQANKLRAEIKTILACVGVYERVRSLVYPEDQPNRAVTDRAEETLDTLRDSVPQLVQWRIYDHCAAITRLYAVYEQFVADIVAEWLGMLPTLYEQYTDLPDTVRVGHRVGVASILGKIPGARYRHLSEDGVLRGIYNGVTGSGAYELLVDAFLIDEQNLRAEVLIKLFSRIGVPDAWRWVCQHGDVDRFLGEVRGYSNTAESELGSFVFYRNVAAHGDVSDILSVDELGKVAQFLVCTCNALSELLMKSAVDRLSVLGRTRRVGRVIREFRDCVVGARIEPGASIQAGDEVVILRDRSCFKVRIESIEVDHTPYGLFHATEASDVGIKFAGKARVGSDIVLVQDRLATGALECDPEPANGDETDELGQAVSDEQLILALEPSTGGDEEEAPEETE